ncbi:MAG TPA: class I SAM-dependent methyltransferase, partial [Longimicrobiales bacterium]|nr:class I SAM-dependent methyltransferase [Longimicrobiales bacterium]
ERENWWSSANFDTWKTLYVSEYARGFDIIDALCAHAPGFEPRGERVLDVGCGDAGALVAFAERGAHCSGIELDGKSLVRGRLRAEEHGVAVQLGRGVAEHLPFAAGAFDLVMLDNVLEHVSDPALSLAEARRVLAPGGLLYLVTPKPFALYSLWNDPHYDMAGLVLMPRRMQVWYFERVRGAGKGAYDVGVIPTRRSVQRMLRDAGFTSVASPRDLWIRYLRNRIARPDEVKPGIKRRLAARLARTAWPFENPVARWGWDVAIGSNFFIARRD